MSKRKVSVVFDHFYIPDNKELVCKARCRYCPLEMSFNRKATSNLLNHMKRKHASIPLSPSSIVGEQSPSTPTTCSQPQSPNKWNSNDPSQILGNQALVNFIASEQLPISIVENPFFLSFVQEIQPSYNMPDRKYIVNTLLEQQTSFLQSKLKTLSSTAQSVCLTVDVWNSTAFTHMTIMGHLVINYSLKSVTFSCKRSSGQHLRVTVTEEIDKVLSQNNISRESIVLLTDCASQGSISLPGFQQMEMAMEMERDGYTDMRILKIEDHDDTAAYGKEDEGSALGRMGLNIQSGPSFAHALQLVVHNGLQATSAATVDALAKVSSKVTPAHNAPLTPDWSSQLKEVKRVLGQAEDRQAQDSNVMSVNLTPFERNLLEDFVHTLQPFEEITDRLRRERVVLASLVIPSIQGIRKHLSSPTEQNQKLVVALEMALEEWLSPFEHRLCYRRATALDPRLKLRWCEGDRAQQMRQDLLALTGGADGDTQDTTIYPQGQAKRTSFFPFFEDEPQEHQPDTQNEAETYLLEPCIPYHHDPLVYWRANQHRFPLLAQQALRHQAIPALPVPATYPDNAKLSDEEYEKLMFIKLNSALLQSKAQFSCSPIA